VADHISLSIRVISLSAHAAASCTVLEPVAMSRSICWRMLLLSTSAHFGAIGTNQLFFAAFSVASLPGTAAALSSSAVSFGRAPFAIKPSWDFVSVKYLIHYWASAWFSLLPLTASAEPPRNVGMGSPAVAPGIGTAATLPFTAVSTIGELGSLGSCRWDCTAPTSQPLPYRNAALPCA